MDNKTKDTVFSILMFALGGYVVFEGIRMYVKAARPPYNITEFSISPAMLPVVLGSGLMLLSIILFIRAFKGEKGFFRTLGARMKEWSSSTVAALRTKEMQRMLGGVFFMFILSFVLLGLIPFTIGGTLFMIAIMMFLRAGRLWKIVGVSVLSMALIFLLFQVAFKTPLP